MVNDDTTYSPSDLLPLCRSEGVPLVYDVHHHRCNQDELSIEKATTEAIATWNREPMFHISSPIEGWKGPKPRRHHDFIDVRDFPECWDGLAVTIEVEAKAKEVAVLKLMPVTLVYQEVQRHQSMALKRELAIKAMSRKAKEGLTAFSRG